MNKPGRWIFFVLLGMAVISMLIASSLLQPAAKGVPHPHIETKIIDKTEADK